MRIGSHNSRNSQNSLYRNLIIFKYKFRRMSHVEGGIHLRGRGSTAGGSPASSGSAAMFDPRISTIISAADEEGGKFGAEPSATRHRHPPSLPTYPNAPPHPLLAGGRGSAASGPLFSDALSALLAAHVPSEPMLLTPQPFPGTLAREPAETLLQRSGGSLGSLSLSQGDLDWLLDASAWASSPPLLPSGENIQGNGWSSGEPDWQLCQSGDWHFSLWLQKAAQG
jgi:hypothetical protein